MLFNCHRRAAFSGRRTCHHAWHAWSNLTRDEALERARLLSVDSYVVQLDLTVSDTSFASTTTVRFSCSEPGAAAFADLVDATVDEILLNGVALDAASAYADSRMP
jgi:aminopeptidase N